MIVVGFARSRSTAHYGIIRIDYDHECLPHMNLTLEIVPSKSIWPFRLEMIEQEIAVISEL